MPNSLFDIRGRVVVLTGACGLIGRVLAKALCERGAVLVLVDRSDVDPLGLASQLSHGSLGVECDVSQSPAVARAVEIALGAFGHVDVLINGHQFKPPGFLAAAAEDHSEELWDAVLAVNLKGTFLTCREFGRAMLGQGKGSIINFASTYGLVSSNPALYEDNSLGNPLAYSASKGGVIMLTKYLGCYWARRGVRVNCITPHGVRNEHEPAFEERFSRMSPIGRMMRAEEVIAPVVFLASDGSSYMTGSNLLVEGGWTAW